MKSVGFLKAIVLEQGENSRKRCWKNQLVTGKKWKKAYWNKKLVVERSILCAFKILLENELYYIYEKRHHKLLHVF